MFDGSSGEVAVLQACEASLISFGQDLDMIGDWEHGEVSREVINIDQDILVILDKEDDNKNVDQWHHLLSVFGTEICGFYYQMNFLSVGSKFLVEQGIRFDIC